MIQILKKILTIKQIILIGTLSMITLLLGMTPLGFIPIGPTRATVMHIPVIIGSILYGPLVGGFLGLIFGISSLITSYITPGIVAFVFLNPLISILPRILLGVGTAYLYKWISKVDKRRLRILMLIIWYSIALYLALGLYFGIYDRYLPSIIINSILLGINIIAIFLTFKKLGELSFDVLISATFGTLLNTVLVLSGIYFLYGRQFAKALGQNPEAAGNAILTIGIVNCIPEIIVAVILSTTVIAIIHQRQLSNSVS